MLISSVQAQRTISGKISDSKGETLIGANVSAKEDNAIGTITDTDGNFSLLISQGVKTLVISYTGFATRELKLTPESVYQIILAEGELLQEVVVTSFGQTTRERFTGSASSINTEQIGLRPITNVGQVLAGAAAGVQATFGSGQPGSAPAVRIRGFGSFSASNDPLYIVDGIPYSANIANLNADDIENVTILKDAASTSLYGSRAANGVIMITTKKGKKGQSNINVKYTRGQSQRGVPEYDRVGAADYYPLMWETYRNSLVSRASNPLTLAAASADASKNLVSLVAYNVYNVPNDQLVGNDGKLNPNARLLYDENEFDWITPLIRNGGRDEIVVSASGGSDDSDYYLSVGKLNDTGFLLRTSFERYTGRLSVNSKMKSWLKTGANLSYTSSVSEDNDAGGNNSFVNPFFFSRGIGPIYPVYAFDPQNPGQFLRNDAGERIFDYGNLNALGLPNRVQYGGRHVVAETLLNRNDFKRNVFSGRTYADFMFLKNFKFTVNAGIDYTNRSDKTFGNPEIGDGAPAGRASASYYNGIGINLQQVLTYKKQFGDHNFDLLAGHETYTLAENELSGSRSQQISAGNFDLVNFTTTTDLTSFTDGRAVEGFLSRINYDYRDKYFISLSGRRDGTSRFSPSTRWGNFYAIGGAWRIDQEDFVRDISWIDNLKLRASYGETGNENVNTYYAYQDFYTLGGGVNNAGEPGLIQDRTPGNPNLKWETSVASDVALEYSLFKNRVTGIVEYFNRNSLDLLFSVPLPYSSGKTSQLANIGRQINNGIETEFNIIPIRTKDFSWTISLNATRLNSKITRMPRKSPGSEEPQEIINGTKKISEGKGQFDYFLREYMGVNPSNGSAEYRAIDFNASNSRITTAGDTVTSNINNARLSYTGDRSIPNWYGGFSNSFSYKGLTISGLFMYNLGGKVYDGAYASLMSSGGYGSAKHPDILNRWQREGDITNVPRLDQGQIANFDAGNSSRWLMDGTSLALRSLTLSYNLPRNLAQKANLKGAQFILSGENLAIWSKRRGVNPFDSFAGVTSNSYSAARTWAGGISLTF
jgi:TonB-linked SusC/RagA family outer membrane protein